MLLTGEQSGRVKQSLAERDRTEVLRQILTKHTQREIGYDEAQEIGTSLIEFYKLLAEEVCDDTTS